MPQFSDNLPEEHFTNAFPIVRTPTRGVLRATVTSARLTCAPVHYYNRRTIPHEIAAECVACQRHRAYRWMAWLVAVTPDEPAQVIFEMTARAARSFEVYASKHGSLRGARLRASRPTGKDNGRIAIEVRPPLRDGPELPKPPDLPAVLTHLWASNLDFATPTQKLSPEAVEEAFVEPSPVWARVSDNGE